MTKTNIFIGEEILAIMTKSRVTKAELSRRLGIKPQSVDYLLKRKSIDTDTLYNVSIALNHNFFSLFSIDTKQIDCDYGTSSNLTAKAKLVIELEIGKNDLQKLDAVKHLKNTWNVEE